MGKHGPSYSTAKDCPEWAVDIFNEVTIKYDVFVDLIWHYTKSGNHGVYWTDNETIEVYASGRHSDKLVLLHELAHAIHWQRFQRKLSEKSHDVEFFKIAYELYIQYDIVEIALEREYATGKKLMKGWYERRERFSECVI